MSNSLIFQCPGGRCRLLSVRAEWYCLDPGAVFDHFCHGQRMDDDTTDIIMKDRGYNVNPERDILCVCIHGSFMYIYIYMYVCYVMLCYVMLCYVMYVCT